MGMSPCLPLCLLLLVGAVVSKPTKGDIKFVTQTSTGRIQSRTKLSDGTWSNALFDYEFNVVNTNKKSENVVHTRALVGQPNETVSWIFENGTYYLSKKDNLCYFLPALNFSAITAGQYKKELSKLGDMTWYDLPKSPKWTTYFGPINDPYNPTAQQGLMEFWGPDTSPGAKKDVMYYYGAAEVSTNTNVGTTFVIFDTVSSIKADPSVLALDSSCLTASTVGGRTSSVEDVKQDIESSKHSAPHLKRVLHSLDKTTTVVKMSQQPSPSETQQRLQQSPWLGGSKDGQRVMETQQVQNKALFLPANVDIKDPPPFNMTGTLYTVASKTNIDTAVSIWWAADNANKVAQRGHKASNNNRITYIKQDAAYYMNGTKCTTDSEGGYDAETDDFKSSHYYYLGKVKYSDVVGDVLCWAFIGLRDPDVAEDRAKAPRVGFYFVDPTTHIPVSIVEPNDWDDGGVIERLYDLKSNKAPTSSEFDLPSACSQRQSAGCDKVAQQAAADCQVKLLMKAVFSSQGCSYLSQSRKCYGDNFCKNSTDYLCGTKLAKDCKLKFCPTK